ncbi:MAG: hypothetical protein AB7D39_06985 [Pseudodesulfovibrio sp.]|uniref:hypothetical protein n=1 Tax=Pseudodesulfovibrio sp. TaxID=2035812 RepID=UPI003D0D1025
MQKTVSSPFRRLAALCLALCALLPACLSGGPASAATSSPRQTSDSAFTVLLPPFENQRPGEDGLRAVLRSLLMENGFRVVEPQALRDGQQRYAGVSNWLSPEWRDGWLARTGADHVVFGKEDGAVLIVGVYPGYEYDESPNELNAYRPGEPGEKQRLADDIGSAVIENARDFVETDTDNKAYALSRQAGKLKAVLGRTDNPFFSSPDNALDLRLALVETLLGLDDQVEDRQVLEEAGAALAPLLASEKDKPDIRGYVWSLSIDRNNRIGDRYGDEDAILRAIEGCRALIGFPESAEDADTMAWAYYELGMNLRLLGRVRNDLDLFRKSNDALLKGLGRAPEAPDWTRGDLHSQLGLNKLDIAWETEDPALLNDAIGHFDRALENFDRKESPWSWGRAHVNRARTLLALAYLKDPAENRDRANRDLRSALEVFTPRSFPGEWASTASGLGRSMVKLGDESGSAERYREAIALLTPAAAQAEEAGEDWTDMTFWLGMAHEQLGETTGDAGRFEAAATWYDKTLGGLPDDDVDLLPYTYKRLGYVFGKLGDGKGLPEYYEKSGRHYAIAATLFARSGDEEECALARVQEGRNYLFLAARTPRIEAVDKALAAFTEALAYFRKNSQPVDAALCHANIARCHLRLGERLDEAAHYATALEHLDEAQKTLTAKDHFSNWLDTVARKGSAYAKLADHYENTDYYDKSIAAYASVLDAIRFEDKPALWVDTQADLGMTIKRKAALTGDAAIAEEARSHFRAALARISREEAPARWARVNNNYANLLCFLGRLSRKTDSLEEGIATYHAVQAVWNREQFPLQWAMTLYNIGNAQLSVADIGEDGETAETALSLLLEAQDNIGDQSPRFKDDISGRIRAARALIRRLRRKSPARPTT